MSNPWRSELSFILLAFLLGAFLGRLIGLPSLMLWVCLTVYLLRHLLHINRLLIWLRGGRTNDLPQGDGIWEEIYYLIYRLRRRNKRRKKQLVRMLERFRTATAALPDAAVVLGQRDQIEWFNAAAAKFLGLRRGDVGQKIGSLIRYPKFSEFIGREEFDSTIGIPSPVNDEIQLEIRMVPYGENLRLLIARDVTHLRFMERVRTDFVANVSHELRTPLTVLKGYLETLDDNSDKLPQSYSKVIPRMEAQAVRMQNLIDGLLSLTRLESPVNLLPIQNVNIPAMLQSICEETQLLGDKRPHLELHIESSANLVGNDQELRSAFSNLVINAMKFCPTDGRVNVRWIDLDEGVCLEVEDTGPGIAKEHIPRLTERFYRVDTGNKMSGSGLGLAIVKHVMARHGAELKIISTLGKGSCFSCCFKADRVVREQRKDNLRTMDTTEEA